MGIVDKILGDPNQKYIKKLQVKVDEINEAEKELERLSDEDIKEKGLELKQQVKEGANLDEVLVPAFSLVREAAKRTLGQRHYDVQLIGGMVLHEKNAGDTRGQIAEMKTGEGKTLTSTLAVYLNALEGKGVHVVTVNDYLAKRDAAWMGQIYAFLGLSTGVIQHAVSYLYDSDVADQKADAKRDQGVEVVDKYLRQVERKEAYEADITYGTNNEFGFDYLRDNMAQTVEQQVQRGLHYAIVDEVDSILIDEARTPLIISAPAESTGSRYQQFAALVGQLEENTHYNIDEKMKAATLTDEGVKKMEELLNVDNIYEAEGLQTIHHMESALKARTLYHRDKEYVVKDGQVVIIDEFTGRMMEGRRFSEGLHQAIEAKEGVEVQRESMTLATITFQNYFRMYTKLAGMTGTAETEKEELLKLYQLDVFTLPTNRPFSRNDMPDKIYKNEKGKYLAIIKEIKERQAKGQPVLVGTISVEKNEMLGDALEKAGVHFNLLNAKNHESEAQIVAQAGKKGAITLATNMAGRGVDIILGGQPKDQKAYEEIKALGGLHVIGTERHESRRIDNQLRGRAGRQGDPGSSQFYISMEDDLMRIFGSDRMKKVMETMGIADDVAIENKMISRSIEAAQKKVEGHNFDIRKHLVEYDDVINKHRQVVYRMRQELLENFSNPEKTDNNYSQEVVLKNISDEINEVVSFHTLGKEDAGDFDSKEIIETINSMFPLTSDEEDGLKSLLEELKINNDHERRGKVIDYLTILSKKKYERLTEDVNKNVNIAENQAWQPMQLIERGLVLRSIDTLWVEHLTAMDKLRTGIGLQGYGQRDPLVEYKREAYILFNNTLAAIRKQIAYSVFKVSIAQKMAVPQIRAQQRQYQEQKKGMSQFEQEVEKREQQDQVIESKPRDEEGNKIGRNDPCYCGSGKKYKKCHGA